MDKKNKGLKNLRSHMSLEQRKAMSRKGGIMSVISKRRKKVLADRIKLALEISTTENVKIIKERINILYNKRHNNNQKKSNNQKLKLLIAQARTINECGIDVYGMLKIAESSIDEDKRMKAINSLWDREEGKAKQQTEITGNIAEPIIISIIAVKTSKPKKKYNKGKRTQK